MVSHSLDCFLVRHLLLHQSSIKIDSSIPGPHHNGSMSETVYLQDNKLLTLHSLNSLHFRREFKKLEKVHAASLTRQVIPTSVRQASSRSSKTDAIFCAGFHAIFISPKPSGEKCSWDAKRTTIIAEGIRAIILNDINVTPEHNGAAGGEVAIIEAEIPEDLKYILGSGGFGTGFIPSSISVTVYSPKWIRWRIINSAMMKKIQRRDDFNSFFSNTKQTAKFIKVIGRRYVVTLPFKSDFQAELLRNIAAGRAHDGQ